MVKNPTDGEDFKDPKKKLFVQSVVSGIRAGSDLEDRLISGCILALESGRDMLRSTSPAYIKKALISW